MIGDTSQPGAADEALRRLSGRLLQLQDEERRRFARELHDSVGQYLAAIEMGLEVTLKISEGMPPNARVTLNDCLAAVRQCAQETRTLSQLLHPPLLDEVGLTFALRDYVRGFSNRSGVDVELELPEGLPRMEADIETALFRIVQESLANVYRHSGSDRAVVRVRREGANVVLEIEDFGRGMPPAILRRRDGGAGQLGVGLQGMHCRVRQLGGSLEIRSGTGGTLVRTDFPARILHV